MKTAEVSGLLFCQFQSGNLECEEGYCPPRRQEDIHLCCMFCENAVDCEFCCTFIEDYFTGVKE